MQNKVTSYETSEALAEAGFDSKEHTGKYVLFDGETDEYGDLIQPTLDGWIYIEHHNCFDYDDDEYETIKAYDCHDLARGLQTLIDDNGMSNNLFLELGAIVMGIHKERNTANALANAILEILKEIE